LPQTQQTGFTRLHLRIFSTFEWLNLAIAVLVLIVLRLSSHFCLKRAARFGFAQAKSGVF
jgi:hypothetical protein